MSDNELQTHIATKKEHRCTTCGRRIPIGARYFSKWNPEAHEYTLLEHTDCESYQSEPLIKPIPSCPRSKGRFTSEAFVTHFRMEEHNDE